MAHLGSLSPDLDVDPDAAVSVERDTFDWYGETFEIAERLSAVVVLRMAWQSREADRMGRRAQLDHKRARTDGERTAADELEATADRDEMAAMYEFLQSVLGPGEWDRFVEQTVLAAAPDDAIGGLIQKLLGVIAARPTRPSSASPDGRWTNTTTSRVNSPSLTAKELQDAELFFAGSTG
jgi:hypothetical protein